MTQEQAHWAGTRSARLQDSTTIRLLLRLGWDPANPESLSLLPFASSDEMWLF